MKKKRIIAIMLILALVLYTIEPIVWAESLIEAKKVTDLEEKVQEEPKDEEQEEEKEKTENKEEEPNKTTQPTEEATKEEKKELEEVEKKEETIEEIVNPIDTQLEVQSVDKLPKAKMNMARIEDGIYTIASALDTNYVLDVYGGYMSDGVNIQLFEDSGAKNQQFQITYYQEGFYTIQAIHSGKKLNVDETNSNVEQRLSNMEDNQKWIIEETSDGYYSIISMYNNLYLDVYGGEIGKGVNIQTHQGNDTLGQKFVLKEKEEMQGEKTVEDGIYTIASALDSNYVLDIYGAYTFDGANVQLHSKGMGENQKFRLSYMGDGFYTIEAVHSGKRLDVHAAGKNNKTNVEQFSNHEGDNQKWIIKKASDGYYQIISKCNGLYLDIDGGVATAGSNIQMYQKTNTLGQKFILEQPGKTIENGTYKIVTALDNNYVLDVYGAYTSDGANVQLHSKGTGNNQRFNVTYTGEGYYTIEAMHSEKKLDVHAGGKSNGTNVEQFSEHGGDNQKWIIQPTEDGYYQIISKCNGLYLDIDGKTAEDGKNVQMYQKDDTLGQKFLFEEAGQVKGTKTIQDGIYKIATAIDTAYVFDVYGGFVNNGANLQLYRRGNDDNQRFRITYAGNGYYTIEAIHSGKLLDVHGSGKANNTNVEQFSEHGGDNQKWVIQLSKDGYYQMISKCNNLYLEITEDEAKKGNNVQVSQGDDSLRQKFVLEPMEEGKEIEDGTYKIVSALDTNLVVDVAGKLKEDGTNVQLNTNGNGKSQRFHITYIGDGYYTIEAMHSGKLLNVSNTNSIEQSNVDQFSDNGGDNQKWKLKKAGNGYYYLVSKCNELYLDVYGGVAGKGTNIQAFHANQTRGQQFMLRLIEEGQTLEDGTYKIATALNTNMVLDIAGDSTVNGANVSLWLRNNNNNQKFKVTYTGDGYYTIQAIHSGKNLDVYKSGTQNGTNVTQFAASGADNQKWQIKETDDGYYHIISKCNGLYLDVHEGIANNGANIEVFQGNGGTNQKFSFDDQYYGIDVSKHQGTIDFGQLSSTGLDFMIIRAGYGRESYQKDVQFERNYQQAKQYGIPVGVYLYSYAKDVDGAIKEANNMLGWIRGKSFELPIFFDIEDPSQAGIDRQTQTDMCIAFCETIRSAGFSKVGIYTGKYWLQNNIDVGRIPDDYRLWVASYGTNNGEMQPRAAYQGRHEIWQYTSVGSIAGINGNVDMNICYQKFF